MMYFHTYKADPAPLNVDIVGDIRRLNDMSVHAKQAGMIVLGGGVCKHQIANAMLFVSDGYYRPANRQRNGADYAVYINTGQEVGQPSACTDISTTVLIRELVRMKQCRGARSVPMQRASR